MNPVFRPIPGYEDAYAVSPDGDVLSLERIVTRSNGSPYRIRRRILQPVRARNGSRYRRVFLYQAGRGAPKGIDALVREVWG